MDRINDPSAPNRVFIDGDIPNGVQGTIVRALWATGIQEELVNVITQSGQTPNAADNTQVWQALLSLGRRSALFKSAGTTNWTCPAGVTSVFVRVQGAGGGGAGSPSGGSAWSGSGGGAGGYTEGWVNVTPGQTYAITVGAFGIAGPPDTSGGAGGPSSFANLLSATGGGGGFANGGGGGGGLGVGGSLNLYGAAGGDGCVSGSNALAVGTGSGGSSRFGGRGAACSVNHTGDALNPGSGGGGGYSHNGVVGGNGGLGFVGLVW